MKSFHSASLFQFSVGSRNFLDIFLAVDVRSTATEDVTS